MRSSHVGVVRGAQGARPPLIKMPPMTNNVTLKATVSSVLVFLRIFAYSSLRCGGLKGARSDCG